MKEVPSQEGAAGVATPKDGPLHRTKGDTGIEEVPLLPDSRPLLPHRSYCGVDDHPAEILRSCGSGGCDRGTPGCAGLAVVNAFVHRGRSAFVACLVAVVMWWAGVCWSAKIGEAEAALSGAGVVSGTRWW